MSELNYEHVFNVLVDKTAEYVTSNNLKAMVLGISGGIDSHGEDVVNKVWSRHLASEFKRKKAPIYISRELYE